MFIGKFKKLNVQLLAAGVATTAVAVLLGMGNLDRFFVSYLMSFLYWAALPFGSIIIFLIHNLTGGSWGPPMKGILDAAMKTLPLIILFFLPLFLGMDALYAWADPAALHDSHHASKLVYLNMPFYTIRMVVFFGYWMILVTLLIRVAKAYLSNPENLKVKNRRLMISGVGIVLYGLTMSFAAVDWLMSLEMEWFTTIQGPLYMIGNTLSAMAFVVIVAAKLMQKPEYREKFGESHFHDMGNLLLAFTMLWAYMTFSQFIIVWSGNLPEEIPWYIHRVRNGWVLIPVLLIVFHFFTPFGMLLMRGIKKNHKALVRVAYIIFAMRLVDIIWNVVPAFESSVRGIHYLDLLLPVGMGLIWLSIFLSHLDGQELSYIVKSQKALKKEKRS